MGHGQSDFQDILITKRIADDYLRNQGLKKIWTPKYLWALGTGSVLTGLYTQWKLCTEIVEPLSVLTAIGIIFFIYLVFIMVLSELAVHFPYAGGPYAFARRGLGPFGGYCAGTAATLQFIFGASAIFILFRTFVLCLVPGTTGIVLGIVTFVLLMAMYVFGAGMPARLQFFLTNCALSGLILFMIGSYGFAHSTAFLSYSNYSFWHGLFLALPLVIWYFFGLEGLAVVTEETKNPQKTMSSGLILTILSIMVFCLGLWFFISKSVPETFFSGEQYHLLSVLQMIQPKDQVLITTFYAVSLCAFVSSLNGFINAFSRQVYSLARSGYYPYVLDRLHSRCRTPYVAILVPGFLSIFISYLAPLKFIVSISIMSALLVHILLFASYYQICKSEPVLFRFRGLFNYPTVFCFVFFLLFAVLIVVIINYNSEIWRIMLVWGLACGYYFFWARQHIREEAPEESRAVSGERKIQIDLH